MDMRHRDTSPLNPLFFPQVLANTGLAWGGGTPEQESEPILLMWKGPRMDSQGATIYRGNCYQNTIRLGQLKACSPPRVNSSFYYGKYT